MTKTKIVNIDPTLKVAKKESFLEAITSDCRALAERFHLNGEQTDVLREYVTTTAMHSWRNGRAIGWERAREQALSAQEGGAESVRNNPD